MKVLQEKSGTREGSRELDVDSLVGTRKTYTITYVVVPNGETPCTCTEEDAMAATGLPALRALGNSSYCIKKSAKEVDPVNGIWEVSCSFDSRASSTAPTVNWSWSAETVEKVIQRDPITKAQITNAAGEPLLLTAPTAIPVLTIERMESSFDPATILNYMNRTNSAAFWGFPVGSALMADIRDEPVESGGTTVRRVTYVIKFDLTIDPDTGDVIGWAVQLLNHGTKFKEDAGGGKVIWVNFRDRFKDASTGNLDLNGYPNDIVKNANDEYELISPVPDPTWLTYNRFPQVNFNTLSLGPY